MDRIIKGYLTNYTEQYGLEYKEENLSELFEDFSTYCILSNEVVNDDLDLNKIESTNTKKYKGIDNICFIVSGKIITNTKELEDILENPGYVDILLIFIQSKISEHFRNTEVANLLDTVTDFIKEKPSYQLTKEAEHCHEMLLLVYDHLSNISKFYSKIYYVTTGMWNEDNVILTTIKDKETIINKSSVFKDGNVKCQLFDNIMLRKLFDKSNKSAKAEFVFKNKSSINFQGISNITEAYFGLLSFREYKKILIDVETDKIRNLFYDNVRDNLGLNDVNNDIKKTLDDKKYDFFPLLNNGITIIAEKNLGSGDKFILENFQIVNGCQTSNILYESRNLDSIDNLLIPIKLVITEDENIKNDITIATNNQTEIKGEQLTALSEFQKGIEEYYNLMSKESTTKLYYERRSNQYAGNISVMKKSIVTLREQIKTFVAVFYEEPHNSAGYFGKILKANKDKLFLKDHSNEPYYLCGLMQYVFKDFLNKKQIDRKYNKARYHLFMLYRKISEIEKFKIELLKQKKKVRKYSDEIIETLKTDKALNYFEKPIVVLNKSGINIDDQKEFYKKSNINNLLDAYNEEYK